MNYNISSDPELAYFDPNNVRLAASSPCRDAGNPLLSYDSQIDMDGRGRVAGLAVDMGAYEVDCEDTSNVWDWNADGLVNLLEFNGFSRAWLAHDPNDPAWLADPNSTDPNLSEGWYEWKNRYNLDTSNGSTYAVDLADLMAWVEESPWLWMACWKTEFYLMESSQTAMRMSSLAESEAILTQAVAEKTAQEQVVDLANTIAQLEKLWLENPDIRQEINPDDWSRFMDSVYHGLFDLQTESVQKEYLDLESL